MLEYTGLLQTHCTIAGESVNDALLRAVSQELLLIAIRLELHTGVWARESIGEAPLKGKRIVDQMLKNTRFGKLPHEITTLYDTESSMTCRLLTFGVLTLCMRLLLNKHF